MENLKILQTVSPLTLYPLGRDNYAGTEQFVYLFDRELTKRGHDSKVIARGDSVLYNDPERKRLVPVLGPAVDKPGFRQNTDNIQFATALRYAAELETILDDYYDIMHSHTTETGRFGKMISTPIVTTLHFPVEWFWDEKVFGQFPHGNHHFVAVSNSQKGFYEKGGHKIQHVIHNGVDLDFFPYSGDKSDYLLVLGRITPEKGQGKAVELAKKAGAKLVIAGGYDDVEFFDSQIRKPHLVDLSVDSEGKLNTFEKYLSEGNVPELVYFGLANNEQKKVLFKNAKALLMPISWNDPCPFVPLEAMACGTPVAAFNMGSMPELIADGYSGRVVSNDAEMIDAIKNIGQIKPSDCRAHIEKSFSLERVVNDYLAYYDFVLSK